MFQSREDDNNNDEDSECFSNSVEMLEELDKINFICSCVVDAAEGGGSVLIPIGRLGIILQLLEVISQALEASKLKVLYPFY